MTTALQFDTAVHSFLRLYLADFGEVYDSTYGEESPGKGEGFDYTAHYRQTDDPEAGVVVEVRIVVDRPVPYLAQYFSSLETRFMAKSELPFVISTRVFHQDDVDGDHLKRSGWDVVEVQRIIEEAPQLVGVS